MKNIYLCGPTVYNSPHIGNMRPIITFDIAIRSMKHLGSSVNLVHNITDIDDKIIQKAEEKNVTEKEIAIKYEEEYKKLLHDFNIQTISSMPRVTDNMKSIINFIEKLVEKGMAYESNGNIYFDVNSYDKYGHISNNDLSKMKYEKNEEKKHPADFALWKKTDKGIVFESAWGYGRPGWHTECVVFIDNEFGKHGLDIHGGGIDLIFPHHENEDAQFHSLYNHDITKQWMHVGHLSINGNKMSKSLKNDMSASEFVNDIGADTLRMIFLLTNPNSPIEINENIIDQAQVQVQKWKTLFLKSDLISKKEVQVKEIAEALASWEFAKANKLINEEIKIFNTEGNNAAKINSIMKMIGFDFSKLKVSKAQKDLIKQWKKLKKNQEFKEADEIRNQLIDLGLI